MARRAEPIILTVQEREKLEAWQRRTTISAGVARRARAILLLAAGKTQGETAKIVGMGRRMVRKWGRRFIKSSREPAKLQPIRQLPASLCELSMNTSAKAH